MTAPRPPQRCLVFVLLGVVAALTPRSRATIEYRVDLAHAAQQTVFVVMDLPSVTDAFVDVRLPAWRPGRYEILDPAGTVRKVAAMGPDGVALPVVKTDKSTWRVTTHGVKHIRFAYELYANSIGNRTRHADDTHAFLSGSSVFTYIEGRRDEPVRVEFLNLPPEWRVATGLEPDGPAFVAADYDVLVDSPFEVGLHDRLVFDVDGVPHEIVIWPTGIDYDAERLTEDFAAIAETQNAIFGRLPYTRYVFLIHVGAAGRGGTEHLNSTIMQTSRASMEGTFEKTRDYERFLGLVSHEFFHTWNVKQLRPAGIHPYDYHRENYTPLLWVAEGTTSYYDDLTLARAGLIETDRYLEVVGGAIDRLRARPGAAVQSLEASSFDAWIKYNRPTPDAVNSTVSFYSKGALVSLLLDAEIRRRSANQITLDDVMRDLFERFPLSGPGYTQGDLLARVETLTSSDFDAFFAAYVAATDPLPLETALTTLGLELVFAPPDDDDDDNDDDNDDGNDDEEDDEGVDAERETTIRPYLGLELRDDRGRTIVRSVLADGPAYDAGIIVDDEIVAVDRRQLRAGDLDARLERREAGDTIKLHIMRREELREIEVTLAGRPDGTWTLRRVETPTDEQRAAYESWIGQAWPAPEEPAPSSAP